MIVKFCITANLSLDNVQLVKNIILVAACSSSIKILDYFSNRLTHVIQTGFAYTFGAILGLALKVLLFFPSFANTLINFLLGVSQFTQFLFHLFLQGDLFLLEVVNLTFVVLALCDEE